MITTRIISTGACVPEQVITNDDLSKIVDTSDEWITQRTGIKRRHISAGENTSYFAINTARQVLERAEVSAEDVDLIIVASYGGLWNTVPCLYGSKGDRCSKCGGIRCKCSVQRIYVCIKHS